MKLRESLKSTSGLHADKILNPLHSQSQPTNQSAATSALPCLYLRNTIDNNITVTSLVL